MEKPLQPIKKLIIIILFIRPILALAIFLQPVVISNRPAIKPLINSWSIHIGDIELSKLISLLNIFDMKISSVITE